jgi:hypothetical protein
MHRCEDLPGSLHAIVLFACLTAMNAHGQNALRGKLLYHDTAGVTGSAVSCVECHGGLPGAAVDFARYSALRFPLFWS